MKPSFSYLVSIVILFLHAFDLVNCDDYEVDLESTNTLDESNKSDNDEFNGPSNVTILWKEFGFRMVCDTDEWREQFDTIKSQMIECLQVKDIVYEAADEREFDKHRKLVAFSGKPSESPYCWLAKNWSKCLRLMVGLECIEPNPKSLNANSQNSYIKKLASAYNSDYFSNDPYDWRNMIAPYNVLCEMIKLQAKSNIFETLGAWL